MPYAKILTDSAKKKPLIILLTQKQLRIWVIFR